MRRIVYLLALPFLLGAVKSQAQSFTMQKDTAAATAYGYIDIYNYVTNQTSAPITLYWRILNHTMPPSWKNGANFGICDNVLCYDTASLGGGTYTMDTITGGGQSSIKLQLNVTSASVTPTGATPVYLTVEVTDGSTTTDTVTYAIYKWGTNVSKISNSREEVMLYPNPAADELNVVFGKDMGVKNVAIYNLVGKQVGNYRVTTNSAKLNIDKIPSGIYFLRLIDANGQIVVTRRFTHQ